MGLAGQECGSGPIALVKRAVLREKCVGLVNLRLRSSGPSSIQTQMLVFTFWSGGDIIILYTGRNCDCYELTKNQLMRAGVEFDELVMGKPQGVYIDKDSVKSIKDL